MNIEHHKNETKGNYSTGNTYSNKSMPEKHVEYHAMTDTEVQYRMYKLKKQIQAIDIINDKINVIKTAKVVLISDHVFDIGKLMLDLDKKLDALEAEKIQALGIMASNLYVLYNIDDDKLRKKIILMFSEKK